MIKYFNLKEQKLDPKQIEIGTKMEMEHTDNPAKARKIALDHLKENPNYYRYMKALECVFHPEDH